MDAAIIYQIFEQLAPIATKQPPESKYLVEYKANVRKVGEFAILLKAGSFQHSAKEILADAKMWIVRSNKLVAMNKQINLKSIMVGRK